MGTSFPDGSSRPRSSARDGLVSILYGVRTSGGSSSPPRPLLQRTMAAGRTSKAVVSSRSITSPSEWIGTPESVSRQT